MRFLTQHCLVWATEVAMANCAPARPRGTLAHFYYVNDALALESLQANSPHMTLVSPAWLTLESTGEVASEVDAAVADWAARRGVALMPTVVNREFRPEIVRAVLENDEGRSRLAASLVNLAASRRFAGLQLDFENVPAELRAEYTRFVEQLSGALRKRRMRLSVAVPAPLAPASAPGEQPSQWRANERAAGYDYSRLGRASEFLTVMTYDQYTSPDEPGPIAGLGWVEACIRSVLESVPAEKVSLGVPLYHRHWSGKAISEGPYADALKLSSKWNAPWQMDAAHHERVLRFSDGGLEHVVWAQDAESIAKRLELVSAHSLAGFSAWRLGQEDPDVWRSVFLRDRRRSK